MLLRCVLLPGDSKQCSRTVARMERYRYESLRFPEQPHATVLLVYFLGFFVPGLAPGGRPLGWVRVSIGLVELFPTFWRFQRITGICTVFCIGIRWREKADSRLRNAKPFGARNPHVRQVVESLLGGRPRL